MITAQTVEAPLMQGVGTTAKATIKASARLFQFFSDQIYADKFVAIWRELVANGQDAHVAAGTTDKSVIVTLPTTFTPYAKVRDFGTGMSHDFLMGPFMAYTDASTKENSNEFIGGFGIGSKAPLAYTEQFAIHSYQQGKLRIYSIFKDDEGCPAIAFLSENDTDEPNGIEISFPVEQGDITKFKDAAFKALSYFRPLPVLKNSTDQLSAPAYTVETETWAFRQGATESQIIQGGVAYPIDTASVPVRLHEILGFGIDFFVPIGTVGIALSRERLSYDDATIRVLGSLCDSIRPKIQEHISKMFAGYATRWEALQAYHTAILGRTQSGRLIESLAEYEGEKLTRYIGPIMSDKVLCAFISDTHYNKYGRNSWSTARANPPFNAWLNEISPIDIQHILIMDTDQKPILRARNFLENMCQRNHGVMIVRKRPDREAESGRNIPAFVNDLNWDEFIKALGSPKTTKLSTIEPATVTRGSSSTRLEKIRAYKAARSTADFVDTLPIDGGYYVEMENFHVKNISQSEISAFDPKGKPVYYFNKGDFEKIKDKPEWVSVKTEVQKQLKEYKKNHKNMLWAEAFVKLRGLSYNDDLGRNVSRLAELLDVKGFACPKRGPINRFATLLHMAKPDLTNKDQAMRGLLKVDASKQITQLRALVAEANTKYPELFLLLRNNYVNSQLISVYNKLI